MADKTPNDPEAFLAQAAQNTGSYGTVDDDPTEDEREYSAWPVWALSPLQESTDLESLTVSKGQARRDVQYVIHIAVLRENGRKSLQALQDEYFDQLQKDMASRGQHKGRYEAISFRRNAGAVGDDEVLFDTLVIECTQNIEYNP